MSYYNNSKATSQEDFITTAKENKKVKSNLNMSKDTSVDNKHAKKLIVFKKMLAK